MTHYAEITIHPVELNREETAVFVGGGTKRTYFKIEIDGKKVVGETCTEVLRKFHVQNEFDSVTLSFESNACLQEVIAFMEDYEPNKPVSHYTGEGF